MAATGPACDALICGMRCAFVTTRPFANVTVKLSLTGRDHETASAREAASPRALAAARKSAGAAVWPKAATGRAARATKARACNGNSGLGMWDSGLLRPNSETGPVATHVRPARIPEQ